MAGKSPEDQHPVKTFGWAARDPSGILSPFKFSRRATGEKDVRMKVLYCGICHTDLHCARNDWGFSTYPLVPGVLDATAKRPGSENEGSNGKVESGLDAAKKDRLMPDL